ncbi:Aerotolerance protein BatB / Aerotolerance protein BatC [hydrothermal vent metagenome]|uniref:Aerotolerance protein BatB / Aerotolerance protein BatC n=1 Tax=hydrothermal vent metagenome TaxID=652676 RepID=A0A3B0ZFL4_9ZZZZ
MNLDEMIQGFHFLRPWWLLLLPFLILVLWYLRRARLQSRRWQSVCDAALLPHLLISESGVRQRRGVLLMVALVGLLAITAMAGPAWKQLEQPVFRDQSALVLMLDLSRSMDATDVKPTRLTRARLKLIDMLKQRKEGQSALIVYAADAFVVSPLTEDAETIVAQISSLKTTLMPQQGSRPDLAIDMAQQLLTQAGATRGDLLLISDGLENVPTDKLQSSVSELSQSGYRLSILGVGDVEGAPIVLPDGGFLKDSSGAIVIPRLDEVGLRDLAQQGGGHYQAMRVDDLDITTLLGAARLINESELKESQGFKADQWREEGPWLLLLLLPLVLMVFRRGNLLVICLVALPLMSMTPGSAEAEESPVSDNQQSWWDDLWSTPDQRASRAFAADDAEQAASLFEDKEWQAAANYRNGNYQQSIDALTGIESAEAYYNKGNAYAQLKQWQAALDAYDQALLRQSKHADAKHNRALVEEQLKQESGESSDDDSQSGESNEDGEQSQQSDSQPGDSQPGESESNSSPDDQSGDQAGDQPGEQSDQQQDGQSSSSDEMGDVPQPSSAGEEGEPSQQEQAQQMSEEGEESADETQQASQAEEADGGDQSEETTATAAELSEAQAEIQRANDQWLRRIPDDPGGLLRRKFQYQSQREKNRSGGQPRSEGEAW